MKNTKIDYTKMKLGTVTQRWTYRDKDGTARAAERRIAKCPKCGKKGECQRYDTYTTYYHEAAISEMIPGFPVLRITDHCSVKNS